MSPKSARFLSLPFLIALAMLTSVQGTPAGAVDPDPALTIRSGAQTVEWKRSELLKRADVAPFHVEHDPTYAGSARDYAHAVPLRPLFEKLSVPADALLQFNCLDGFSAPLARDRLLSGKAIPYLAIEAPGEHWPEIGSGAGKKSLAPFYLVWKDPAKSQIGPEEWPFALAGFTVQGSLVEAYPKIQPDAKASAQVKRGLAVFVKNCFACHTLNHEGKSHMGPDLNVPLSPTEYFSETHLRKLIRNPQDMRSWTESKMSHFPESAIPNADLTDLIAYLRRMAERRKP